MAIHPNLIEGHLSLIRAVARAMLRKSPGLQAQVELGDLFHTGILAAYIALGRYGQDLSDALLSECCRNAMLKLMRSEYRQKGPNLPSPSTRGTFRRESIDEGPLPDLLVEQEEDRRRLWKAWGELGERDRRVLVAIIRGRTQAGIARQIKISQPAVSKIKKRALDSLRFRLAA